MHPVLFHWRGIRVYSYPALLYVGLVLGVLGGTHAATLHGLDPTRVFAAQLLLILPALLFVASRWGTSSSANRNAFGRATTAAPPCMIRRLF